jgi:phage RecT family recombinase
MQQNQQQTMSGNEVVSAKQQLAGVMAQLESRREELAHVLPRDVSFDQFIVSANQALRNNPKLLRCTTGSIVNACVKAAYDGLRIDGKEAAIVDAEESYKEGNAWKKRAVARYMPMVFGLIKQILQSGLVLDVKAVIVYANEIATGRFELLEGTNPGIKHMPILTGDKGAMVGAYSTALLKSGVRTFEWMDAAAIIDVMKEAKTKKVWERWPTEMWKKTVVRRHRKTLPSTKDVIIRDMEAEEMFPQFDRNQPHPQFADGMIGHNSMAMQQQRPTRQSIADQQGTGSGTPLDMGGGFDGSTGEIIDHDRDDQREDSRDQQQDQQREVQQDRGQQDDGRDTDLDLPDSEQAWGVWGLDIERKLAAAKDSAELDRVWKDSAPIRVEASKAIRDRLTGILTDRTADMAADAAAGAGADEQ